MRSDLAGALLCASLATGVALTPRGARADGPFVVVRELSGPRSASVRSALVTAMADRAELISQRELDATIREEELDEELEGRELARACAPLGLTGVVEGEVRGGSVELRVRSCADGGTLERATVPMRRRRADPRALRAAVARFVQRLATVRTAGGSDAGGGGSREAQSWTGDADADADANADGAEVDEDDGDDETDSDVDDDEFTRVSGPVSPSLLALSAGLEVGGRSFHYTDPITDNLRPYDLFGAPSVVASAELYPLSRFGVPVVSDIGLQASYALAFALTSRPEAGGDSVDTSYSRLQAGLRARIRTGAGAPVIGLGMGYGFTRFEFPGAASEDELPDVDYTFLRWGVDAQIPFGTRVALSASAGYLGVLGAGRLDDRFPRSSGGGIDAALGARWRAAGPLALHAVLSYTRFFFTLNPEVGDAYVAGGALDEFLGLQLGATYAN